MSYYEFHDYDHWLMTDPRDYIPNPSDYWEDVTEEEMFDFAMDEYPNDFTEFLWDQEFYEDDVVENIEKTYKAWEEGDPELLRLLNKFYDDPDMQERLLRSMYPDLWE